MHGKTKDQVELFRQITFEERIPPKHPFGKIRKIVDEMLRSVSARFDAAYAKNGRTGTGTDVHLRAQCLGYRAHLQFDGGLGGFVTRNRYQQPN